MSHDPKDDKTSQVDKVERVDENECSEDWSEFSEEETDEWVELSSDEYETDDDDLGEDFVENAVDLFTFFKKLGRGEQPKEAHKYIYCPICDCDPCDCYDY